MAGYKFEKASRKLSAEEKKELVAEVRDNVEESFNFDRGNRIEAETDLEFLAGNQWPDFVKQQRGTTRPMLTINQLPQFVHQVTNPTRESDIAIKAVPVDGGTDPMKAKIFNGLIRQIESQSTAKTVYVTGHEHQTSCGLGNWQICTQYVDDAIFEQEIRLKKIENPLAVFYDPAAVEPDRSDGMWTAVIEQWPISRFKREYPEASVTDVVVPDAASNNQTFSWRTEDVIAVAMYYKKVPATRILAMTESEQTHDITDLDQAALMAMDSQDHIVKTRECHTHRIEKYLVTGDEVLEGPIDWAGKYIPVVPVLGAEIPSKQGVKRHGIVRFMRDPQQLMNFYRTAAAEQIALAPKAPYVVTMKQVGPYKQYWDTLNTENRPWLPYMPDETAGAQNPPKREHPPETPVALIQQGEIASEDMKRVSGIYDASLGAKSNETSGVAIGNRQQQGMTANSHYADNLFHSLVYTGRILIDLIPRVYDSQRMIRILGDDDEEEVVAINQLGYDPNTGVPTILNDMSTGRFDVRVTVGKSFLSKRVESVAHMIELAKTLPPEAQVLFLDLIVKNSDWPGAEEIAKRLKTLVPPAALADPNDPNAPQPPDPMDDPMVIAQLEKLAAEIEKMKETALLTQAQREHEEAKRLKTMAETDAIDADTDHNIISPSINGSVPSVSGSKPNGASAPPYH